MKPLTPLQARIITLLKDNGQMRQILQELAVSSPDPHVRARAQEALAQALALNGGEVERYFREGKIKEIADYCETDVIGTYQVWLRYELFRGTLSQNAFDASQRNLVDFMNARFSSIEG